MMSIDVPPRRRRCELCKRWDRRVQYCVGMRMDLCDVCVRVILAKRRAEQKAREAVAGGWARPAAYTAIAATFGGAGAAVAYWILRAVW